MCIFRHGLRLRGKKPLEAADTSPAEAEVEEDKKEEEEEKETQTENKEEQTNEGREDEEDTDDCEVCPGTEASHFIICVVLFNAPMLLMECLLLVLWLVIHYIS